MSRTALARTAAIVDAEIARKAVSVVSDVSHPLGETHTAHPLDEIEAFLRRFVAYPSEHACVAHALWIVHTHLMEQADSTPRIAFLSPEPGSGKSRALEVTELLVPNAVQAVNVTPAYLFRKVGSKEGRPTILYDEIDTVFGPRAKENEEIRGLLNAGHRKSGVAGRCVVRGKEVFTEEISAYCAVALAGLGGLPDTILSRCVIVKMRRRSPDEQVEPFRRRAEEERGTELQSHIAAWAAAIGDSLADKWPTMPDGIADRDADVWEALLAIADAAGGDWPARARVSAVSLVSEAKAGTPSLGVRLLADLKLVFGTQGVMTTDEIIRALCALDEAPWGDLQGKPIDARRLAKRLHEYGVKPKQVRIGERTFKGYDRSDLHDPWLRYLSVSHKGSETSETRETVGRAGASVSDVSHSADGASVEGAL